MIKEKVEVESRDQDLRASRFPRTKGNPQGKRNEYIFLLLPSLPEAVTLE